MKTLYPKVSIIILNWNGPEDVSYNSTVWLKFYCEEAQSGIP